MTVRDDRGDVKQTTTGFRGPLMVQSLTSAKSKFLSLIVTYCGHLYPHKGVHHLIQAAKYLPDILFCIVGGWPEDIERCRGLARGIDNLMFVGFVPNRDVPKYLAAADLLILPNSMRHKDAYFTSPLKLFEYMSAGKPIVASDIPAFKSLLRHRENAYLVTPDSDRAIAGGIEALCNDRALSQTIADRARRDVQRFTWAKRAESILKHFNIEGR